MKLDFGSLVKATDSFNRAIARSQSSPKDEELRDAVIQRFGYTYELCWKMLKRKIEQDVPNPAEIDLLSFRELIREGAERGFIREAEEWMVFREQRNITSHTYDRKKAESVYKTALRFYPEAVALLKELQKRNEH